MTSEKPPRIRPLALAVVRRGDEILVVERYDSVKRQTFYRPAGGGIEFGERGEDAVDREFREEFGAGLVDVRLLGPLENIFTFEGVPGHELVLVYEARPVDESWLERDERRGREENGSEFRVLWKPLDEFPPEAPLYPPGLLDLLRTGDP